MGAGSCSLKEKVYNRFKSVTSSIGCQILLASTRSDVLSELRSEKPFNERNSNEEMRPSVCNYLTNGRDVPLRLSFFLDGCGTPIPMSKLVKNLGVQTDGALCSVH